MRQIYTLILFLAISFSASAQEALRSISGTITDDKGKPVEMLSIGLEGSVLGANTNQQGYFEIKGIKPGRYTLRASGVGYGAIRQQVDLTQNQTLQLDLNIKSNQHNLKEVVVSASRSVESLDETPASVHVVDQLAIRNQMQISPNISNVLAMTVPGLALHSNTTSNVGQTLRGRNVLVMIDGIPQSTPLRAGGRDIRTIDPEAIERVEVVKGATAIYGNGADGGLINYITKKPATDKPFSAYTSITGTGMPVNSRDTFGGRISQQFSGKYKGFDYVASGTYEKTGVFKDGEGEVISPVYGLGETNMYNAFLKTGYNFNSDQRLELMYNYFGSQQASEYVEQAGVYGERPTIGVRGERKGADEGTRYNHNAQLKYIANNLIGSTSLEAAAYLQKFSTVYGYSAYFVDGGQSTILSDKKGARLSLNTPVLQHTNFNGNIVYGVDYMNDITSQPLVDGRIWVPEINMKNAAPYAQLQLNVLNDFIFKAGYRFDNVNVQVADFTQLVLAQGGGGHDVQGGTIKFNASTYNFGLRYAGLEFFKPFVSFSQGFSVIDVGRYVRSAQEDDIAKMGIEPVIVNNYEAGFHSNFGILSLSGAYFISTSELGASLVSNAENTGTQLNRAPERVHGFEVVTDLFLSDKLKLGASAAYSEGKLDANSNDRFYDAEDMYLIGTRIAPLKLTSYINVKPLEKLNVNLQWLYSGSRKHFEPRANGRYGYGEGPVSAFDLFNLTSSYQVSDRLNLNLGIENLLNKSYYLPIAYLTGFDADYTRANGARFQVGANFKW
jgi:iron complex outermembrane receptor protein